MGDFPPPLKGSFVMAKIRHEMLAEDEDNRPLRQDDRDEILLCISKLSRRILALEIFMFAILTAWMIHNCNH